MKTKKKKQQSLLESELAPRHIATAFIVAAFTVGFLFGSSISGLKYDLVMAEVSQVHAKQTARLLDSLNLTRTRLLNTTQPGTGIDTLALFVASNSGVQSVTNTGNTISVPNTKNGSYIVIEDEVMLYSTNGDMRYAVYPSYQSLLTNTLNTYASTKNLSLSHEYAGAILNSGTGDYIVIEDQIMGFFDKDNSFQFAVTKSGSGVTTNDIVNFASKFGYIIIDDIEGN